MRLRSLGFEIADQMIPITDRVPLHQRPAAVRTKGQFSNSAKFKKMWNTSFKEKEVKNHARLSLESRSFRRARRRVDWTAETEFYRQLDELSAYTYEATGTGKGMVTKTPGSVDVYFGPTASAGFEKNWIPTIPGKAWFSYFRLYGPTEAYFDKSWPLPDIEEVK
jgi:hypothetical protein